MKVCNEDICLPEEKSSWSNGGNGIMCWYLHMTIRGLSLRWNDEQASSHAQPCFFRKFLTSEPDVLFKHWIVRKVCLMHAKFMSLTSVYGMLSRNKQFPVHCIIVVHGSMLYSLGCDPSMILSFVLQLLHQKFSVLSHFSVRAFRLKSCMWRNYTYSVIAYWRTLPP